MLKVELGEERVKSERYKKQSQILRLELDHLLQQLTAYVIIMMSSSSSCLSFMNLPDAL